MTQRTSLLPSGGGLAGFVAGTIFAIIPGVMVVGISAMAGGWAPFIAMIVVIAASVSLGLIVRKLVNRFVHGTRS